MELTHVSRFRKVVEIQCWEEDGTKKVRIVASEDETPLGRWPFLAFLVTIVSFLRRPHRKPLPNVWIVMFRVVQIPHPEIHPTQSIHGATATSIYWRHYTRIFTQNRDTGIIYMRTIYRSILRGGGYNQVIWEIPLNGVRLLIKIGLSGNLKLIKFPEKFHFDIWISLNVSYAMSFVFWHTNTNQLSWPISSPIVDP